MTDVRVVLGIDPGLSGAIARLTPHPDHDLQVWDMPTLEVVRNGKKRRELDLNALRDFFRDLTYVASTEVWLERVSTRPGEGAVGAFTFGRAYGHVEAMVASFCIPINYVTPAVWKRNMSVPAGKDAARLRASQVLPSGAGHWRRAKDDGRAEAALIAAYGLLYGGRA